MPTDNEIISKVQELSALVDRLGRETERIKGYESLTEAAKESQLDALYSGLRGDMTAERGELVRLLRDKAEQERKANVNKAVELLRDNVYQSFVTAAVVGIESGAVDMQTAAAVAEQVAGDDVALSKLRRAAAGVGGSFELPAARKQVDYERLALLVENEISFSAARTAPELTQAMLADIRESISMGQ